MVNLFSEHMLEHVEASLNSDRNKVMSTRTRSRTRSRTTASDPKRPLGFVHEGDYIASLISVFPYRLGAVISESTCYEFVIHVAATYSKKALEYHDNTQHSINGDNSTTTCYQKIITDTRKLLQTPPGYKPGLYICTIKC